MSGQIFISYRREDNPAWARLVHNRLSQHFSQSEIFMDVDTIEPGIDFVEAIEESVGSCDVLIAMIGAHWLSAVDPQGGRRLDNPEDSVRLEMSDRTQAQDSSNPSIGRWREDASSSRTSR